MNNKFFKTLIVATALVASSSVFAQNRLSAFEGVPTEAVSQAELDQVSGEGFRDYLRTGFIKGAQISAAIVINTLNAGVDVSNILSGKYCPSCR